MSLRELKVGDDIVLVERRRFPETNVRKKVESIGRKYLVVDGYQFSLDTGKWANKDYSFQRHVCTIDEWTRLTQEVELIALVEDLRTALAKSSTRSNLADVRLAAEIFHMKSLMTTLTGKTYDHA